MLLDLNHIIIYLTALATILQEIIPILVKLNVKK